MLLGVALYHLTVILSKVGLIDKSVVSQRTLVSLQIVDHNLLAVIGSWLHKGKNAIEGIVEDRLWIYVHHVSSRVHLSATDCAV